MSHIVIVAYGPSPGREAELESLVREQPPISGILGL